MRGINKILLENILPAHVAEHYLLRAQGVAGVLRDTNVSAFETSPVTAEPEPECSKLRGIMLISKFLRGADFSKLG